MTPYQNQSIQEYMDEQRRISLRRTWNAPELHVDLHGKTKPSVGWEKQLTDLRSKLFSGFLVALVGSTGVGKTMLAVELMFDVTEKLKSAYYMTAISFFIQIKSTFRDNSEETEAAIMERLQKQSLLVIEEVSRRAQSDWENNLMFELINSRYNLKRDTLLIDNSTASNFASAIDPAIASRMKEKGGIIEANWGSFR